MISITNIIRADMYRLFRGKAIYITFAILLALAVLNVFISDAVVEATITIGVVTMEEANEASLPEAPAFTGARAAMLAVSNMGIMAFFFLPLIIIVSMTMFSTGAVKNELSAGLSRTKLYAAKFILSFCLCMALMFSYAFSNFLLATISNGFGYWGGDLVPFLLKGFGALMLITLAFASLGVFLSFTTRRTAAVNGLYLAIILIPAMIVSVVVLAFPGAIAYMDYDLFNQFHVFLYAVVNPSSQLIRSIAVCLAFIIIPTIAGVSFFRKAEIK